MKKYLSVLIAIFVFGAFPSVLGCRCEGEDCGVSKMIRAKAPQCHPAEDPVKEEDSSRKDCCARCRIERVEFASKELGESVILRTPKAADASQGLNEVVRFSKSFSGSCRIFQSKTADFFTSYIVNHTFAFRGPPAG